ncbi:3-oxoacyl-[acyl-carrier protein] reductase [Oikeobacillus pervagus]|uniref:3-oxoacyl-[acyl-carrier protein] reductase n=1 Tax=Oikeobacillus pervagus TaxID=1325931 RepID=A0AAJ1WGA6_9BACI|nr:SDR family oxidoreductase [Oikeobacillus pervagus]MDQ0214832.1 3-oxoacyl-[acyl-carrier protein] reductase [Oikeobacillus pervagus]
MPNLKGKNALVVASSQGLGEAIARKFAKEGANVMLASRNEQKLQMIQEELAPNSEGVIKWVKCDVTNARDIKNMVTETNQSFGPLNILVNNAGGPPAGTFEDMSDEDWNNGFELNLLSYIRIIREALPSLKQSGGKIINIASSSIKEPIPGLILSNTFRTGIIGLSKTLAQEFAPYRILVNTVAPGRIATERIRQLDEINAQKLNLPIEEVQKVMKEKIPLKRYGEPEEFANVVAFLASDENSYMTGSSFLVDGGMVKSI